MGSYYIEHIHGWSPNRLDSRAWVSHRLYISNDGGLRMAPSYGTPFLLGLGLSEHITSLVWLAGPISGLIAQPVIGDVVLLIYNT